MTKRQDTPYEAWVRGLPCAECKGNGPMVWPVRPHHLKGDLNASGGSMRAPDYLSMPLCDNCHTLFHSSQPFPSGKDKKMLQRGWLLRTMILAFELGVLTVRQED